MREGSPAGMEADGLGRGGGAWARWRAWFCARAPMLTLELDRVGWPGRRCDGRWVSLQMGCGRSFFLGLSPVGVGTIAGSWPRFII